MAVTLKTYYFLSVVWTKGNLHVHVNSVFHDAIFCFLLGSLLLCYFAASPHSLPVCCTFLSLTIYFFYWETSSKSVLSSSDGSCQNTSIWHQVFVWTVMTICLFAVAVSWLSVFLVCYSLVIIKLSTKIPFEGLWVYFLLCKRSIPCKVVYCNLSGNRSR